MKLERRDRETGRWEPCEDSEAALARVCENYANPDAAATALDHGAILTTGFADYRKAIEEETQ